MPYIVKLKSLPMDQYLCSGLDIYICEEPNLCDSMALVHSRISRVIFKYPNTQSGCIKSAMRLQFIRSLNHHYRVYSPET